MSGPDRDDLWLKVQEWIAIAADDQRAARTLISLDPPLLGIAAYHIQQAAEKLLKAVLVRANRDFRKTHDLEGLVRIAVETTGSLASFATPMGDWTAWSVMFRYPSETGPEPEPPVEELWAALDVLASFQDALQALGHPG